MLRISIFLLLIPITIIQNREGDRLLTPQVVGDWDGQFIGKVVERSDGNPGEESQTDSMVFLFQHQSGNEVTGEVVFGEGYPYELRIPLEGTIAKNRFNYHAKGRLDGCSFILEAETTINSTETEFSGEQTQANCEGKAIGRITAIKRSKQRND